MNDTRYWILNRRLRRVTRAMSAKGRYSKVQTLDWKWTTWASARVAYLNQPCKPGAK